MAEQPLEQPRSGAELLRDGASLLQARLPDGWRVSIQEEQTSQRFDAFLTVTNGSNEAARFVVEVKGLLMRRDVPVVSQRLLKAAAGELLDTGALVMSRYLAPPVREALESESVAYIDVTGNMLLQAREPALFIRDRGAEKDPWRGPGRPRATLAGEPAARVVRALISRRGPWSARDLVAASGASTGATYRVLEYLRDEDLVAKEGTEYVATDWPRLLQQWSRSYGFFTNSRTFNFIEPRGLEALLARMTDSGYGPYAVTGSIAASEWSPYAPSRAAMVYVENAKKAAKLWGLRPTDKGGNIILAEPEFDVVFAGSTRSRGGYVIAAPEQVAVDLLTGPGRNPSEGAELIRWMTMNESAWRRG